MITKPFRFMSAMLALGLLALLGSCATKVSYEQDFLNKRLDDKAKARALVEVGTSSFNSLVNDKGDVDPVDLIKEYFQVALKFDPSNETAQKMLTQIDDYRSSKLRDSLAEAKRLMLKDTRKDEEVLSLLVAVNKASALDPKNAEVIKLKADTDKIRKDLVSAKTAAAKAAIEKSSAATSDASRDEQLVGAWTIINQALRVAPADAEAGGVRDSLSKQIGSMVDNRLSGLAKLLDAAKFTAAKTQIDSADDLNIKLGGASSKTVADARYNLYKRWAVYLLDKKDYDAAEARAQQAQDIRRDAEIRGLIAAIGDARSKEMAGASYVNNLAAIDKLLSANDLVPALKQINSLAAAIKDADKLAQVELRRKKLNAAIPELYKQGVDAYRAEKFDLAIQSLGTVVALNPDYEQAKDFLDKARQKKKFLEQ
jgi:tetratricopeptide (TPR) repeat protein